MGNKPDTGLPRRKVAVLGGGLAGLSAARRLLEHGCEVTLVERRPFLGGRAYSFRDGKDGPEVDNGQHVFLGAAPTTLTSSRRSALSIRHTYQRR